MPPGLNKSPPRVGWNFQPAAAPALFFARDAINRLQRKDQQNMIKVKSRGNETAEQMLRRFKKMCEKEGLTKDIKRIAYYEKPSEKRRRRQRSGKPRLVGGRSSAGR
jgi:small subunit ribosomal protein S21